LHRWLVLGTIEAAKVSEETVLLNEIADGVQGGFVKVRCGDLESPVVFRIDGFCGADGVHQ